MDSVVISQPGSSTPEPVAAPNALSAQFQSAENSGAEDKPEAKPVTAAPKKPLTVRDSLNAARQKVEQKDAATAAEKVGDKTIDKTKPATP
ncbi:MAG TPA: hypothetical protein VIJ94_19920, partial [Caulobacteraceae bacterium]